MGPGLVAGVPMMDLPIFFEAQHFKSEQMTFFEPSLLSEGEDLGSTEALGLSPLGLGFWIDVPDLNQNRINMDMHRFRIFKFF